MKPIVVGAVAVESVLEQDKIAYAIVGESLRDVKREHVALCRLVAATMVRNGEFGVAMMVARACMGRQERQNEFRSMARRIVRDYQVAGIIPSPLFLTIGYWVIRLVIIPWVEAIIREYFARTVNPSFYICGE